MALVVAIVVLLILVALLYAALLYNTLVSKRNRVDNAWAQIDVQLKRRHDLVPSLVKTVKSYAAEESGALQAVTEARAAAVDARSPAEVGAAEGALSQVLGRLFAVAEAHPELKASESLRDLRAQLAITEDGIAVSQQTHNDTVLTYNSSIHAFPAALLAGALGFSKRDLFGLDDAGGLPGGEAG